MKFPNWIAVSVSFGLLAASSPQTSGQQTPERLWLAGRYAGDRVVVYFETVKFGESIESRGRKIAPPVAEQFFSPVELPASYVAEFHRGPESDHFAVGDRYDLLLGDGGITTVRLTTLVGCETDEAVGNPSYIGAIATAERPDSLLFTKNVYVVRHHHESKSSEAGTKVETETKYAGLMDIPIRLDIETEMARLLGQRMKSEATEAEQRLAGGVSPAFKVQALQLADGSQRYYVRAEWKSGREKEPAEHPFSLAAWMAPAPTLRILAREKRSTGYGDFGLPELLNVVDLGSGRTGIIMEVRGDDSRALVLAEYRDGATIGAMRELQSIQTAE